MGAGASLKDIEIVSTESGPEVKFSGNAAAAAGGKTIKLSISHSESTAVAFAVAK